MNDVARKVKEGVLIIMIGGDMNAHSSKECGG